MDKALIGDKAGPVEKAAGPKTPGLTSFTGKVYNISGKKG